MKRIRTFLTPTQHSEAGFTIIEVVVAMMVFAIIAVGIAYSLTTTLVTSRDSRARQVASNLAAQQIDNARSFQNVFKVDSGTSTQAVDGTTYTIKQSVNWVSSTGTASLCGTAGGLLQAKAVNVSVTWSGQRIAGSAVQANTMLAPSGPLNDPSMGTILVHVVNAAGTGVAGVAVSAKKDTSVSGNTAQAPNPQPPSTDADGCSYVLKVVPGSYLITIGSAGNGYIGSDQTLTPSKPIQVKANDSVTAEFTYDQAAMLAVTYTSTVSLAGAMFPSSLDVSLASVNALDDVTTSVSSASASSNVPVFPFPGGYSAVFAGNSAAPNGQAPACLSVNSVNWTTANSVGAVGAPPPSVTTAAGSTPPVNVAMGAVTVKNLSGKYLKAVSATPPSGSGDPGCATGSTYYFPSTIPSNSATVALPYGTWQLYYGGTSSSITTLITSSYLGSVLGTLLSGSSTITLDPRAAS
ncbi:MAG TPA: type II secretion system protein [Microbacteriaceae bacterium]